MPLLQPLLQIHEYEDEYQETVNVLGYMYDEAHDTLYFHKGVNVDYIRRLLGPTETQQDPYDPYKEMDYQFEEVYPPRDDDQRDYINFIAGEQGHQSNVNDSQIFLVATTGAGKTFCTGYGIGLFGAKTLIIVHRDNLRSQWVKSLYDLNGYSSHEVYELKSSAELEMIAEGVVNLNYDIYLMTHATFRAACNRIQDAEKIRCIARNLHIGMKVIDEAHLEFRDTLFIDYMFNVRRNLYLTATDGRSSRDENAIFQHVFSNTTFYRKSVSTNGTHPSKWVEYIVVDINTHVKPAVYRYRVNGGRGMSAITYGKFVIKADKKKTHFTVCKEILKEIFTREPSAKVLVFMPLIDLCMDAALFFRMGLNNDDDFEYSVNVRTYHSRNTKVENERNKHADVIVTTIQSLGTGSDIKGVTDIINCTPIVSKIVVKQVLGRIRYIEKPCHYYDIVDQSVPADLFWWGSRKKTLKSLCTRYTHLKWTSDEEVSKE